MMLFVGIGIYTLVSIIASSIDGRMRKVAAPLVRAATWLTAIDSVRLGVILLRTFLLLTLLISPRLPLLIPVWVGLIWLWWRALDQLVSDIKNQSDEVATLPRHWDSLIRVRLGLPAMYMVWVIESLIDHSPLAAFVHVLLGLLVFVGGFCLTEPGSKTTCPGAIRRLGHRLAPSKINPASL